MHKNYGAAVAKGSHRIIFGTIRKENTEILQEKTKRIIPVFGDTFVSAKGMHYHLLQVENYLLICVLTYVDKQKN